MTTFNCLVFVTCLASATLAITVDIQKGLNLTICISRIIKGIESKVDTSDPLSNALIDIQLPDFIFKAKDATLTGLKYCVVAKLRINKEQSTFDYNLECPSIEFKGKYIVKGQLGEIWVEGEGDATVTAGFYIFNFHVYYDKIIEEDLEEHAHIKNYSVVFEPREKIEYRLENLYGGDKEKSDAALKYMDDNWRFMDQHIGQLVLHKFMDVLIHNLNDYLKSVPIIELFKKHVKILCTGYVFAYSQRTAMMRLMGYK